MVDRNGTRAAIRAGYGEKTAEIHACRLLRNDKVRSQVEARTARIAQRLEISATKVLQELAKIAFANMQAFMPVNADGSPRLDFSDLSQEDWAAVQEVIVDEYVERTPGGPSNIKRVRFKLADKARALELLGKYFQLFVERHQHEFSIDFTKLSDTEFESFGSLFTKAAMGNGSEEEKASQDSELLSRERTIEARALPPAP